MPRTSVSYRFDLKTRALTLTDTTFDRDMVFELSSFGDDRLINVAELLCQAYQAGFSRGYDAASPIDAAEKTDGR